MHPSRRKKKLKQQSPLGKPLLSGSSLSQWPNEPNRMDPMGTRQRQESNLGQHKRRERYPNLVQQADEKGTTEILHSKPKLGKLSAIIKWSFALPTFSMLPIVVFLNIYAVQFYELLGAPVAALGFCIALARGFDVLTDPFMSFLTDSARFKFGRRRPFCLCGCLLYSCALLALFSPPRDHSSVNLILWFGISYISFFLANTLMTIPYDALGPELTDNYDDRSRLYFISGLVEGFGTLFAVSSPLMFNKLVVILNVNTKTCNYYCQHLNNTSNSNYTLKWCKINKNTTKAFSSNVTNLCNCLETQVFACSVADQRSAFKLIAYLFSIFLVLTMINMIFQIKERSQLKYFKLRAGPTYKSLPEPNPLVPSIWSILSNRPFTSLLPAWVCDASVNAIISSLMIFYVRYVIRPEYQARAGGDSFDCNQGIPIKGMESDQWQCKSEMVVSISVVALLLCAILSTPIWLQITKRFGKRIAWLSWSFTMACTNFLFIFLGKGDVYGCIIISAINGAPFGAKFLQDAILADVIDYDEFLTGSRNEAMYMMFRSFLPKICAVPASAIPLAFLSAVGHVPSKDGRIMPQPNTVVIYIKIIIVILPTILSFIAFFFKLRFPLKAKYQVEAIGIAVGDHLMGNTAPDPVTGIMYAPMKRKAEEIRMLHVLEHFPSLPLQPPKDLHFNIRKIYKRLLVRATIFFFFIPILLIVVSFSIPLLKKNGFEWIPIIFIIGLGLCVAVIVFYMLSIRAAKRLMNTDLRGISAELVHKLTIHRKNIQNLYQSNARFKPRRSSITPVALSMTSYENQEWLNSDTIRENFNTVIRGIRAIGDELGKENITLQEEKMIYDVSQAVKKILHISSPTSPSISPKSPHGGFPSTSLKENKSSGLNHQFPNYTQSTVLLCEHDLINPADVHCLDCKENVKNYCSECHQVLHKKASMRSHRWIPIKLICGNCECVPTAIYHCDPCKKSYCLSCDRAIHKLRAYRSHYRKKENVTCEHCQDKNNPPEFFCTDINCRQARCLSCHDTCHKNLHAVGHHSFQLRLQKYSKRLTAGDGSRPGSQTGSLSHTKKRGPEYRSC